MEWISIKDRLPKLYEWVIVFTSHDEDFFLPPDIFVAQRDSDEFKERFISAHGDGWIHDRLTITHWMPLPEPPKD